MGLDAYKTDDNIGGGGSGVQPKPDGVEIPEEYEWEEMSSYQRWYYKNKEEAKKKVRESVKNHRENRIEWLREQKKKEWCCEVCGEDHYKVLQFHHTQDNEIDKPIKELVRSHSMDKIEREIKMGKILCANCHLKMHYDEDEGYKSIDDL